MFQDYGFSVNVRNKLVFPPLTYIHPLVFAPINSKDTNIKSLLNFSNFVKLFKETYDYENMISYNAQELLDKNSIDYKIKSDNIYLVFNDKKVLPNHNLKDNELYTYSIDSFLAETLPIYVIFIDICKQKNITKVIDIGCASGMQSLFFNMNDIDYIGIDNDINNKFFPFVLCNRLSYSENSEDIHHYTIRSNVYNSTLYTNYLIGTFPSIISTSFELVDDNNNTITFYNITNENQTAFISSLCAFYVVHESLEIQMNALLKCNIGLLYIPNDAVDYFLSNETFNRCMNLDIIVSYMGSSIVYINRKEK